MDSHNRALAYTKPGKRWQVLSKRMRSMAAKRDEHDPVPSMLAADAAAALAAYCPDLEQWPRRWHFDEPDLPPGQAIVAFIKPFLLHLLSEELTTKTRHRHRDNR